MAWLTALAYTIQLQGKYKAAEVEGEAMIRCYEKRMGRSESQAKIFNPEISFPLVLLSHERGHSSIALSNQNMYSSRD